MYTPISYNKDDPQHEEDSLGDVMNAKIKFKNYLEPKEQKEILRPEDVEDYEGVLNDLEDLMRILHPGNYQKQLIEMKAMVVMYLPHKDATVEILEAISDIKELDSKPKDYTVIFRESDLVNKTRSDQKAIEGKIQDLQEVIKEQYDRIQQ